MVMEASPSPQSVGREFVRQYYTLLNKAPAHLHRFYNNYSSFVHGGLDAPNRETLPVVGQKQIHNRIQQLNFRDCHAKISQVDAQATLGSGVVVQVTGELSNDGAPMRRFTQTFVLAAQSPKKYYVHNDIFRYQDIVFSDEEGEGSGRSEGEEEGAGGAGAGGAGYFPGAFPGGFPAPPPAPPALLAPLSPPAPAAPSAPAAPLAPAPAPSAPAPHLNGHPQHHDDNVRHVAAALHASGLVAAVEAESSEPSVEERAPEPAPEPEREPEPEPEPQPPQPVVQAPPEPKTYANLLKSGGAVRVSPPAAGFLPAPPAPSAPAPPAGPPVSAAPPQEQRARHPRAAPHQGAGEGRERESREREVRETRETREVRAPRYSDAQQLFLGNLPHSATEEELRALFLRFGPVAELRVHSKPAQSGAPRHPNYGFITYESAQHAHDCLAAAPLYFPPDSADGVKLNVEEKKARGRGGEPGGGGGGAGGAGGGRRRPLSGQRAAPPFPARTPHRR